MTGETENQQQEAQAHSRRSLLQTLGVAATGVGGITASAETVRADAEFDLEIRSVPDEIVAGKRSNQPLEVYVKNRGDETDTQTVRVNIGRERKSVTLGPGDDQTLNFNLRPRRTRTGDQRVDVSCRDDEERTRVRILEPAQHEIEIGEVDDRIVAGREFTFVIEVKNVGEASERKEVEWKVEEKGSFGGLVADGDTGASPPGGETQKISRTVETKESGSNELLIQAGNEDDAGTKTVEQIPPQDPAFEVTIGDDISEINEGEEMTVPVDLFNTGDFEGTKPVTLMLGDQELATQEVTIDQRSSTRTSFTAAVPYEMAGQQKLTVSSESNETTKTVEVGETPQFEVDLLEHNSPIPQDFSFEFEVEVTNVAGVNGQDSVSVTVGDLGSDSQSFELESGASNTVTLSVGVGDAAFDTYEATVATASPATATEGMRTTTEVEVAEVPFIEVSNVSTNAPVQAGSDLEVTAVFRNTGSAPGNQEVQAVLPDVGEASADIELEVDEETEETLVIGTEAGDSGEHDLQVGSESTTTTQTLEIGEAPEETEQGEPTQTSTETEDGGDNDDDDDSGGVVTEEDGNNAPGFGIGTAVSSLGGAAYLLKRRLNDDEE